MSSRLRRPLVGLLLAGMLASAVEARRRDRAWRSQSVRYANRDFERMVNLATPTGQGFSTLEDTRYNLYVLETEHFWKLGDRWSLHVNVPYLVAFAEGNVNRQGTLTPFQDTVHGFRDILLTPSYWLVDPDSPAGGHNISMQLRLNVGRQELDPSQQQVLNFIREGGLGLLSPAWQLGQDVQALFSAGTGVSIANNWSWRFGNTRAFDFDASYTYTGTYAPTSNLPTSVNPSDAIQLGGIYRYSPHRKRRTAVGLNTRFFTSGTVRNAQNDTFPGPQVRTDPDLLNSVIPGKRPDLNHEPDWTITLTRDSIHSTRTSSRYGLSYTHTGERDVVTTNGAIIRRVRPGDFANVNYTGIHKAAPGFLLSYGADVGHIGRTRAPGIAFPDSQRTLATANLGVTRSTRTGHTYSGTFRVGLNEETPRLQADVRYTFAW